MKPNNFIMKHINPSSLKKQILVLSVFNSLTILICVVIGYSICVHVYNKYLYHTTANGLYASSNTISEKLRAIEALSTTIMSSSAIQNTLNSIGQEYDPAHVTGYNQTIMTNLFNYRNTFRDSGISYIALFNNHFTSCTNWAYLEKTNKNLLHFSKESGLEGDGKIMWNYIGRTDYFILSRNIRRIDDMSFESLGTLLIAVDMNQLVSSATKNITDKSADYIITDKDQSLIYASHSMSDDKINHFLSKNKAPYSITSFQDHTYFSVTGILPYYDFNYISIISFDEIDHSLMALRNIIIIITILGFMTVILFTNHLIKLMTSQLNSIVYKMIQFSETQLTTDIFDHSTFYYDELKAIHEKFHIMADKINTLIKVNYTNEILTKDARLNALKTQINPHFLYNTLQTINWRSKAAGDTQTSQIIESLGTLLRASLSNERPLVTLAYELNLVECYITIQRIRFEDRLVFDVRAEERLKSATIPPLIIQPLVENAIHYGMEQMTELCHISLSALKDDNLLIIYVKNEGSTFEDNLLERLRSKDIQANGFGIGLMNIDQRIKLMYGDEYSLIVYNEHTYAVAKITIPFQTGEQDYVENDHR